MTRLPRWAPLAVLLCAVVLLALASADVATLLSWDRMRLWDGQLWRLFTGHLVHANAWHVIINLTGLLLVILLFGNILNSLRWCALMGVAAVSVSVGLLLTAVWPQTYVGLSGVLHGLVAAPLVLLMRRTTLPVIALFVTLWGKVMFEFVYGASAMSERMIGIPVATHAHLFGALAGTAVGVWFRWRQRAAVNTR